MSQQRRSAARVRSFKDLLALTNCSEAQELAHLVEARVDAVAVRDIGYYTVRVADDHGVLVVRVHTRGTGLEYPFPVAQFWDAVDDLAAIAALQIIAETTFSHDNFVDTWTFTNQLADFFQVTPLEILQHLGGGWRPIEGVDSERQHGTGPDWYGAGDPLQVVMSIGADWASVAVPVEVPMGLAGPAHIECSHVVDVELGTETTMQVLGDAVDAAIARSRRRLHHCQGCRRYQRIWESQQGRRYCRDCMTVYFGLIID